MDARDSHAFIDALIALRPQILQPLAAAEASGGNALIGRAADCGAGIGRVAKHVLLHRCAHVDLVEQSPRLLNAAPEYLLRREDRSASASGGELKSTPTRKYSREHFSCINIGLQVNRCCSP